MVNGRSGGGAWGRRGRASAVERYLQSRPSLVAVDAEFGPDGERGPAPDAHAAPPLRVLVKAEPSDRPSTPDLLHPEPSVTVDRAGLVRALEFAFVAGDAAGAAGGALRRAAIADSTFSPACFADDLFVDAFVADCLQFPLDGQPAPIDTLHLTRLLCHPPSDPGTVAFRQDILAELCEEPKLPAALRALHAAIIELIRLFDEAGNHGRLDLPRWRLDVLRAVRAALDALAGPPPSEPRPATTGASDREVGPQVPPHPLRSARSGLSRLSTFAQRVQTSDAYRDLCALLEFEADSARVNLQLRLGADGRVRTLDVMQATERPVAPFYRTPLSRFAYRLLTLFRGYRLGEGELVERYLDSVFAGVLPLLPALLQLRGDLEFYLSGLHLRGLAQQRGLPMCLPRIDGPQPPGQAVPRAIDALWNPLLLTAGMRPVPCRLDVDALEHTCIITGPNSGGKTRLLQALSYVQLLGQAGLFVPASAARLRIAPSLFVSLGHEMSADQREGRLGTELMRIRRLFEQAQPGSLVVLDELCSGTNPSEGIEIFELVLDLLPELRPEAYITTHFLQFAQALSEQTAGRPLCFLQVDLDADNCPTYQFVPGVARTSLASQTAARLGVTRDELLQLIRRPR